MVLLVSMSVIRRHLRAPVRVLHFDHGIHNRSGDWARMVFQAAENLQMDCEIQCLGLGPGAGETLARQARYQHISARLCQDEFYLSAHHADDQAETFLLQALRGSGVDGLAAMPEIRRVGEGWLARPFLSWSRDDLLTWARSQGLSWIEDPANSNLRVPRNRLRHQITPTLASLASQPGKRLAATASRLAETRQLLEDLAREDLATLCPERRPWALSVMKLRALSVPRRHNLLRYWLRLLGLPMPSARKLQEVGSRLIGSEASVSGCVAWPGCEIRLYHGKLYPMEPLPPLPQGLQLTVAGRHFEIDGCGRLLVDRPANGWTGYRLPEDAVSIAFRHGGERLTPAGKSHHRSLKKLMQEQGVLPWMRARVPLLYIYDRLAIAADVAATEYAMKSGLSLCWIPLRGMALKERQG